MALFCAEGVVIPSDGEEYSPETTCVE